MADEKTLFVTGKLAEPSLRLSLSSISDNLGHPFEIETLPINVVALATTDWIRTHIKVPPGITEIILPGLCRGSEQQLSQELGVPVKKGPKDLRDLPQYFKMSGITAITDSKNNIAILAEINDAPSLPYPDILNASRNFIQQGADIIDLGCMPGQEWADLGRTIQALKREGIKVSIDTFNPKEARQAAEAGATLLLSVYHETLPELLDLDLEFVVVPDKPGNLDSIKKSVDLLIAKDKKFRIDPILEPLPYGFTRSIVNYFKTREIFPDIPMMMGIGNITELMDGDSSGINTLLIGICQECGIQSILTTSVINWCRTSVEEINLARNLMHYAMTKQTLPKRLENRLLLLRDPFLRKHGMSTLRRLASEIKDRNLRIFAEEERIHAMNKNLFLSSDDPFELFGEINKSENIDTPHAFYLGFEFCKAMIANQLGKNYTQDQELQWGFLTREEKTHRNSRTNSTPKNDQNAD